MCRPEPAFRPALAFAIASVAAMELLGGCAAAGPAADSPSDSGPAAWDAGLPDAGKPDGGGADAGAAPDAGVADASVPDGGGAAGMQLGLQGSVLLSPDGGPLVLRGAISCCGGGYGWPLFDDAWLALTAAKQANFLHARLGPFLTQNANGETDWAAIGGGYVEVNGIADLSRFNGAFWSRLEQLLAAARAQGQWVEIDVADGWAIKHCRHGDIPGYSAWDPAWNLQGENACAAAGSAALVPGSTQERWVRQVVDATGAFDNVLYQDGNELGLVPGYSVEWTRSLLAVIRDEEALRGFPRHLFGTDSGDSGAMLLPGVDYVELHQDGAASLGQCQQKACLVNEYNPNPPLTPEQFRERYCAARTQGTWFWYWRHDQSEADMLASLELQTEACP